MPLASSLALYRSFCTRLVQLGAGVVAVTKKRWLSLTCSGNGEGTHSTKSLNAAQLACSTRRYEMHTVTAHF